MPVFNNMLAGASGGGAGAGYEIERSLRFNSGDSAYLNRTPSAAGNRESWTWSGWVKQSSLATSRQCLFGAYGANSDTDFLDIGFDGNSIYATVNSVASQGTAKFRDPSAWFHYFVRYDGSNLKWFINGVETHTWARTGNLAVNGAFAHQIGRSPGGGGRYFDGYLADVHFIDGQALAPTDFGETDDNGVWQPKKFAGTYGTNGFHLDFADNSSNAALGTDTSGVSPANTWTVNNLSVAAGAGNDSLRDTPTNGTQTDTGAGGEVVGNYATLNPLRSDLTLTNGNLDSAGTSGWTGAAATIGMSSGKWYWEIDNVVSNEHVVGIVKGDVNQITWNTTYGYGAETGVKYLATGGVAYGAAWTTGDVIGIAFDADNGSLTFYKNGTSQGVAATGLTDGPYFPSVVHNGSSRTSSINFGQRPFQYQNAGTNRPNADYKSLNTANLPDPTIEDGSKYFDTKLYTGTGSSQSLTMENSSMSPDFVWIKNRSTTNSSVLFDAIRGATKFLKSDDTLNETTATNTLTSFDSNGFTVSSNNKTGVSGSTFVAWAWDAGSSNTTIAAGSLNSSLYDQSQTWSNGTQSNADTGRPLTNLFDNSTSTLIAAASGSNSSNKITLPVSITAQTSVRYYSMAGGYNNGPTTLSNSGTTVSTIAAESSQSTGWKSFSGSFPMTFNEFTVQRSADAGGTGSGAALLEVDGKILVDSGVSVTNVPTIASTVRANPSAGFSIVNYTGTGATGTIGHGLNAKPELIIVKNRTNASDWYVFGDSIDSTYDERLTLNSTGAKTSSTSAMNATAPTSSVFTVGGNAGTNGSGTNVLAYCFAPVEGYSLFGSYQGNGLTDGPFVYTGFKPRWVMIKNKTMTGSSYTSWFIQDTERSPINPLPNANMLFANRSAEEGKRGDGLTTSPAYNDIDFLSNGFKPRTASTHELNDASHTYIYAAFAEHPFKTARAR